MSDFRHFGAYKVDLDELTVYLEKDGGELQDLSTWRKPIESLEELRVFIRALGTNASFGKKKQKRMIQAVEAAIKHRS